MFDDIRRNFLMNPSNGLRIRAFRQAHVNRSSDKELLKLAKYLKEIATVEDLCTLNHRNWEKLVTKKRKDKKRKRKRSGTGSSVMDGNSSSANSDNADCGGSLSDSGLDDDNGPLDGANL